MVDADGYRPNVGIVVANDYGQVLWARRIGGHDAWQFPQGGINEDETPEQALYRELHEEIGLSEQCVRIVACTTGWLHYRLPRRLRRYDSAPRVRNRSGFYSKCWPPMIVFVYRSRRSLSSIIGDGSATGTL